MKTQKPTTNSFIENFLEEVNPFSNFALILKTSLDLHFLSSNSLPSNFQVPKTKNKKKKNAKFQSLLSKYLMLQDCRMISILIYLTGVLQMKQELVQGRQFLFGMLKLVMCLDFVRISHHLVMIKRIYQLVDLNSHITQV